MALAAILLALPLATLAEDEAPKGKLSVTADNWTVTLYGKGRPAQLKGGKDAVDAPAGTWRVRYQLLGGEAGKSAAIYGFLKEQVTIEAGKTVELKVGGPFTAEIEAKVQGKAVAFNLAVKDAAGAAVTAIAAPKDGKAVTPKIEVVDKSGKTVHTASLEFG